MVGEEACSYRKVQVRQGPLPANFASLSYENILFWRELYFRVDWGLVYNSVLLPLKGDDLAFNSGQQ